MSSAIDRTVTWRILMQPVLLPVSRVAAAAVLVASFALSPGRLGPDLCPLHRVTGLPCPGCGVTRGLLHLSHGDVDLALGANPFVLVLWPLLVALALSAALPRRRVEAFEAFVARHEPWPSRVVRVLVVAFFGFGLLRFGYFLASGQPFP